MTSCHRNRVCVICISWTANDFPHYWPFAKRFHCCEVVSSHNHDMETPSCYWPFARGIYWWSVNSPQKPVKQDSTVEVLIYDIKARTNYTTTGPAALENWCMHREVYKATMCLLTVNFKIDIAILTVCHEEVMSWKRFPQYWPFVSGMHWWPMPSTHKRPVMRGCVCWFVCFFYYEPGCTGVTAVLR